MTMGLENWTLLELVMLIKSAFFFIFQLNT
jgi:hypothetical protein